MPVKRAMNAKTIAKALGRRKACGDWMARCAAHHDRESRLSIRDAYDGKLLVRCHAGCDQGRAIAALRSRGLWQENSRSRFARPVASVATQHQPDQDDTKRSDAV